MDAMPEPGTIIRKQVYELTQEDLDKFSLWEFCSDEEDVEGQDEATVKPSTESEVRGYSPGAYILTADVLFPDGAQGIGYVYSSEPNDIGCLQPNLAIETRQINFWLGSLVYAGNVETHIAASYAALGRNSDQTFPLVFITRSPIAGSRQRSSVEGFMALGEYGRLVKLN